MVSIRLVLLASLLFLVIGCGSKDAPPIPVHGTVTLNGQPLPGAIVRFVPVGSTEGHGGSGFTGTDGTYKLDRIRAGTKLHSGEYKVIITKRVMPDGSTPDPKFDMQAKEILDPTYSLESETILKAQVAQEGGKFDFELETIAADKK